MVTGEERLRENLADLYGAVNGYDGRPSQTQVERADAIGREVSDIIRDFDAWSAKEIAGLNSALAGKKLDPVVIMTRQEWEARNSAAH